MALLAIDLGGTKLATAVFSEEGKIISSDTIYLDGRGGDDVCTLICAQVKNIIDARATSDPIRSIGICIPGIYRQKTGTVWAPNIPGWDDYPLAAELRAISGEIPVTVDSDRACYILGELWQGNAKGCRDAIYLAVGTGIGAGILIDGNILRGAHDIAGAIGWMALNMPFDAAYIDSGCFESQASGKGIAAVAQKLAEHTTGYTGPLSDKSAGTITAHEVWSALDSNDPVAKKVIDQCIIYWGMAVANLVSLFNPEKIILGGGLFGPALRFIPDIYSEAEKWAQPISIHQVVLEQSALGSDAGVYGAAFLALKTIF